jgi:beta-lactamase class C
LARRARPRPDRRRHRALPPQGRRRPRDRHAPGEPQPLPIAPADWHGRIDYRALDARFKTMMTDRSMEGLAVAVVEDGRVAFVRGYGLTSADNGRPVDAHTVFRWASLSKTVSGTLSARLAADGVFSLTDPLETFHTSLRLPGDAQNTLTVEQLLSQRTGLPKHAYDDRLEDGKDPAEIRQALGAVPPACPPGTCHSYQNVAYDTITEVIRARTGEAYADTVQKHLFGPLGMTTASIGEAGIVTSKDWARPHGDRRVLPMSEAYYRVPAAAGVNSTIVDLATWMQAQMGLRPDVLPPAVLDAVQRPRVETARPYGRSSIGRA